MEPGLERISGKLYHHSTAYLKLSSITSEISQHSCKRGKSWRCFERRGATRVSICQSSKVSENFLNWSWNRDTVENHEQDAACKADDTTTTTKNEVEQSRQREACPIGQKYVLEKVKGRNPGSWTYNFHVLNKLRVHRMIQQSRLWQIDLRYPKISWEAISKVHVTLCNCYLQGLASNSIQEIINLWKIWWCLGTMLDITRDSSKVRERRSNKVEKKNRQNDRGMRPVV